MTDTGNRRIFYLFILLIILALPSLAEGQNEETSKPEKQKSLWKKVVEENLIKKAERLAVPEKYLVFRLDRAILKNLLSETPLEFSFGAIHKEVILEVPTPEGRIVRFRIEESPILSPKIAAQFPTWKTFSGQGIDDPAAIARFDWSGNGFHGMVVGSDGTFLIDPYQVDDLTTYAVYKKSDFSSGRSNFHCRMDEMISREGSEVLGLSVGGQNDISNGANLRTYRLAIATTGEYTQSFGGQTQAFNEVMSAVNRINLLFRKELSAQFTLVSGTNTIYPDPNTDPYNNTSENAQLDINHNNLNTVIGNANFDIGHLFGTDGGGVAEQPSLCNDEVKGQAYSGDQPLSGDPFWVDVVSHELAHQFNGNHTYNLLEGGGCSTRNPLTAYEVASGVTVLSYVGVCDVRNLQAIAIDVFHDRTLQQLVPFVNNMQPNGGGSCGTAAATGNNIPVIGALTNRTIPRLTPFTLTASATDADAGDALTYSWEQYDQAPSPSGPNGTPANTFDVDTDGIARPLFRNYAPTASPSRTFPSLVYILNNSNTPPLTYTGTSATGAVCPNGATCVVGENMPSIARTMNFRVVVRDNRAAAGAIADRGMTVTTVAGAGPFRVTSQNQNPTNWQGNSQQTITWDVSNTNQAPINTTNVNILLSTDAGQTFPTVLAANTPNDGSQAITVPNTATTTARIKVEAVGNVYFDINDVNLTITAGPNNVRRFMDFDGDNRTDISIFRPGPGEWWYLRSSDNVGRAFQFGQGTDQIVAADYTGDGLTDIAFFRPASGEWFVLRSEDSSFFAFPFGANGDIPVPGDFDGDGRADPAVFRPSTATWFINNSGGGTTIQQFGANGDAPLIQDFDGDGRTDLAVYRPTVSEWYIQRSSDMQVRGFQFGTNGDVAIPSDYTGDGSADVAFFRPSNGEWFVLRSEDDSFFAFPFGAPGDIVVPGDYDGDGRSDPAVFRPSNNTWFLQQSTNGFMAVQFGIANDRPLPNAYIR